MFSVIETVNKSWKLYKNNLGKILGAYAAIIVIYLVIMGIYLGIMFANIFEPMTGFFVFMFISWIFSILSVVFLFAFLSVIYKTLKKKSFSFIEEIGNLKGNAIKFAIFMIIISLIINGIVIFSGGDAYLRVVELSFSNPAFSNGVMQQGYDASSQEYMKYMDELEVLFSSLLIVYALMFVLNIVVGLLIFYAPAEMALKKIGIKKALLNSISMLKTNFLSTLAFVLLWGILVLVPMFIPCIGFLISLFLTIPMAAIAYVIFWDSRKNEVNKWEFQ